MKVEEVYSGNTTSHAWQTLVPKVLVEKNLWAHFQRLWVLVQGGTRNWSLHHHASHSTCWGTPGYSLSQNLSLSMQSFRLLFSKFVASFQEPGSFLQINVRCLKVSWDVHWMRLVFSSHRDSPPLSPPSFPSLEFSFSLLTCSSFSWV